MARNRGKLHAATRQKLQQIVRLQAVDKAPSEIASLMGMSVATVQDLMSTDDYRQLHERYLGEIYQNFDKMVEKRNAGFLMEQASPDAAEALIALIHSDDEVQKRLAAIAVLDRAGHGPVQRRAVKHRHELDPATVALLGGAMKESKTIDIDAIEAEIVGDGDGYELADKTGTDAE